MAETQKIGHIKVNAHDDEVVIYAGKHEDDPSAPSAARAVAQAPVEAEASSIRDEGARDAQGQPQLVRKDAYHATTLEDIRSFRMSTAQKAVIIVAVLGLVAFVVWYAAFSG